MKICRLPRLEQKPGEIIRRGGFLLANTQDLAYVFGPLTSTPKYNKGYSFTNASGRKLQNLSFKEFYDETVTRT